MNSDLWVTEKFEDIMALSFKVTKTLFSGKSDFQSVDVVETAGHGKMLLNDGLVMLTEKDEFVYHDMISHTPLFVHPNPENVLIIGGGDGGTAREVLRHKNVKKVVMVEIDKMVVDACREFIPQTASELSNPKLELLFADGLVYVRDTKIKFDVVIVDSTDPVGPAQPLFGDDFYRDIHKCLKEDGIVVSQGESPWYHQEMQLKLASILDKFFPIVRFCNFHNMSYPGGLWSFSFASKKYHPLKDFNECKVAESQLDFKYYNQEIHKGAFSLPSFQYNNLKKHLKDGNE